jgi:hypothetical protein
MSDNIRIQASDNTILEKEQYMILYGSSHIALLSLACALYKGEYDISTGISCIFLTSINFWRKPDNSWRKTLDMTVSISCITYQHIIAYRAQYAVQYYTVYFLAFLSFLVGCEYGKRKELWKSTYSHLTFHILCNLGNFILYSGYIRPDNTIISDLTFKN